MISIAVAALEPGILTISPDTYFALPEGEVVTTLVWLVVFVVPELFVKPVKRTQEIRSTTRADTRRVFLFMVLTEPGDYFKKSFLFLAFISLPQVGSGGGDLLIVQGEKRENPGKKQEGLFFLLFRTFKGFNQGDF
jgi:hypothetical protein